MRVVDPVADGLIEGEGNPGGRRDAEDFAPAEYRLASPRDGRRIGLGFLGLSRPDGEAEERDQQKLARYEPPPRAAATKSRKSFRVRSSRSSKISGCHCTPTRKWSVPDSMASTMPSGAWADA